MKTAEFSKGNRTDKSVFAMRGRLSGLTALFLAVFLGTSDLIGQDWPLWRGPRQDGSYTGKPVPLVWSETRNVAWKIPVPGRGHSSPIVVGQHVFLTTADEETEKQIVLCFDRANGNRRWRTVLHEGGFMPRHMNNSQASATPASDGKRLFIVFLNRSALWLTALDFNGKVLWQQKAGPYDLAPDNEGYGSSLTLEQSLVILNGDSRRHGFIAAFNRDKGTKAWQIARRPAGSFGTPVVATLSGKRQLILSGSRTVDGYDPLTGQRLWTCQGTAEATANTMAFGPDRVLASGGAPQKDMVCIRTDGQGDVGKSHVLWRTHRSITYVPSPLYYEGHFYVINDQGIARCLRADDGKEQWSERLQGSFKASPVRVGNRIYACDEEGRTHVLQASTTFQRIRINSLDEGAYASPALSDGQLFLRTLSHLYCLAAP